MSQTYFAWTVENKTIIIEHTMTSLKQVWEGTQFMHVFMLMYVSMLEISIHLGNPFSIYIYLFISVFVFSWVFFIYFYFMFSFVDFVVDLSSFFKVLSTTVCDNNRHNMRHRIRSRFTSRHGRKNYNHRHGEENYLIVRFYCWHLYCALSGKKMYIIVLLNKVNVYYFKFKSF